LRRGWKPVPRQSAGHLTVETADSVVWLNTYPMPCQSSLASCLMILAVWSSMPDTLAQNLTLNFIGRISAKLRLNTYSSAPVCRKLFEDLTNPKP